MSFKKTFWYHEDLVDFNIVGVFLVDVQIVLALASGRLCRLVPGSFCHNP